MSGIVTFGDIAGGGVDSLFTGVTAWNELLGRTELAGGMLLDGLDGALGTADGGTDGGKGACGPRGG